jgi:hypothetical protein
MKLAKAFDREAISIAARAGYDAPSPDKRTPPVSQPRRHAMSMRYSVHRLHILDLFLGETCNQDIPSRNVFEIGGLQRQDTFSNSKPTTTSTCTVSGLPAEVTIRPPCDSTTL